MPESLPGVDGVDTQQGKACKIIRSQAGKTASKFHSNPANIVNGFATSSNAYISLGLPIGPEARTYKHGMAREQLDPTN